MFLLGYASALLMGLSLGLIGGGGSILTVPILVYFFAMDPLSATSESLFVVGMTALIGGVLAYRNKQVNLGTVAKFAVPSFLGVFLMKKIILPLVPNEIFHIRNFLFTKSLLVMGIFALLMLIVSRSMIKSKKIESAKSDYTNANTAKVGLQGFFVGNITGLVGAGGGFLIVPALVNLIGLNMREAIGTSLVIIALNSLFGFSVAVANGHLVNWPILLAILALSVVGLLVGRFFSKKIAEAKLKKGFGVFVLIMGTAILIDQATKLF